MRWIDWTSWTPRCHSSKASALFPLVLALALAPGIPSHAQAQATPQPSPSNAPAQPPAQQLDAQQSGAQPAEARPLPDIEALMRQVEAHQKAAETIRKDYLYHSIETQKELAGNGSVKKTTVEEHDVFWIGGVPVAKLVRKDGRDLTPDEQKKESERLDKEVAKAQEKKEKADAKGKDTSPRGDDMITVSRFLELGSFTKPRRIVMDGRDTILVDYTGNPKAKTRNRAEEVVRDLVGTLWIDEQDKVIRKTEGHFIDAFKIGGGLLVNIRKDTSFGFVQTKVNGEVWLPQQMHGEGAARALLIFNFNGSLMVQISDYRKFKATSTILPEVNTVDEAMPPGSTSQPPPASQQ